MSFHLLLLWRFNNKNLVFQLLDLVTDEHILQFSSQVRLVHIEVMSAEDVAIDTSVTTEQVGALFGTLLVVSYDHFETSNMS